MLHLRALLQGLGFPGKFITALVERVNLTIRQRVAELVRRTWSTAQRKPFSWPTSNEGEPTTTSPDRTSGCEWNWRYDESVGVGVNRRGIGRGRWRWPRD